MQFLLNNVPGFCLYLAPNSLQQFLVCGTNVDVIARIRLVFFSKIQRRERLLANIMAYICHHI
jgi:hypothetical protein